MSQMMPPPEEAGVLEAGYEDVSDEDIMAEAEGLREEEPIADELLEDIVFSFEDEDNDGFEDALRRAKEYLGLEGMEELDGEGMGGEENVGAEPVEELGGLGPAGPAENLGGLP